MSGLDKQTVTWALIGGMQGKTSPFAVQPGSFLTLENVRQERKNEWRARQPMMRDAANATSALRVVSLPGGGALGMLPNNAGGLPSVGTTIYSPLSPSANSAWLDSASDNSAQGPPKVWARKFVSSAVNAPSGVSRAASPKIALTAWWSSVDNQARSELTSAIEGTTRTFGGSDTKWFGTANQPIRPRCVYNPSAAILMMFWVEKATGNVKGATFNATTGTILIGPATVDAGASAADPYIDAVYYTGANATVVYRTAANAIRFLEVTSNLTTATAVTLAVNCNTCLALLPDPNASGVRFVATYDTAGTALRILRVTSAGAISTNDPIIEATAVEQVAGVAYSAGAGWMVVYETAAALKACKKRLGVVGAITTISGFTGGRYSLASGAWREPTTDMMRYTIRYRGAEGGGGVAGSFADPQRTYYEMLLEFDNQSPTISNNYPEAQARMLPFEASGNLANAGLGHVQRLGTENFATALVRLMRFDRAAAVEQDQWAIDGWTVNYFTTANAATLNVGEGTSTGTTAYLPDGQLLQTAIGDLVCGHGASTEPIIGSLTAGAGGGLTASSTYQFLLTVDMWDDAGNVWSSAPSTAQIIALGVGQTKVTVVAWFGEFENRIRKRTTKLWRTASNGSVFRLVAAVTDICPNNIQVTFVDTAADTALASSQFLSSDLPAALTPAFSHTALFGNRLWGIERDFPQNLWFSKPLEAGRAPEFPEEFIVNVEDVTGDPTLMLPMDDKLCAFKRNAIYVVTGDGPDNTGAGQFPSVTRIDSDVGSGWPHGVSTGDEVYFVAQRGAYRMTKALQLDWFEQLDAFFNQPAVDMTVSKVAGIIFSPQDDEVRIQTDQGRFTFDRASQVWSRDTGAAMIGGVITRVLVGASQLATSQQMQVIFMANGEAWNDRPDDATEVALDDDGTPFTGIIRAPWIGPPEGWLRLYRVRALGYRVKDDNLGTVHPQMTIFFDNDDDLFEVSAGALAPGGSKTIRGEMRPRRQKCSRYSVQLTIVTSVAVRLEAFSAVVAAKRGSQPLPANDRWA